MKTQAARLQKAREDAGFRSAREAAEKFEWNYSTYASHENGSRGLRLHAARKYGRAFGVDPLWLMAGEPDHEKGAPNFIPIGQVPLCGEVAAGLWAEASNLYQDDQEYIPASPSKVFPAETQFALKVRGTSMNKLVRDGDYVIAGRYGHGRTERDGDVIVVQRERGGLIETSLKRFRVVKGERLAIPESDDPRFQQPLKLDSPEPDTIVQIIGIVIGIFVPLE